MGLTGLKGGGYAGFDYNVSALAGRRFHPYGTRAVDSSGGEYVYVKASTVAAPVTVGSLTGGKLVYCAPGADPWQATILSTAASLSTVQGLLLGLQYSTATTTTQDTWIQVAGPMTACLDTTAAAAGINLFTSTISAGAMSVTTTGIRLYGVYIQSSAGAGGVAAGAPYPVNAPNGIIAHTA